MSNCDFGCTVCNGDFCDRSIARCSVCGAERPTGLMWEIGGKYVCSECHLRQIHLQGHGVEKR